MTNQRFLNRLVASVQDNPFAATLIAGGVLWSLVGNRPIVRAAQAVRDAAAPAIDNASERLSAEPLSRLNVEGPVSSLREKAASAATENVTRWRNAAKEAAQQGWSGVRERVGDLPDPRPAVKDSYDSARTMLADVLERQPLVLGVIGIGIGTAIAGAFNATASERDLMGPASDAVRADLSARVGAVGNKLREGADTLKAELGDSGAEAADRLKKAGNDAVDAAREKAGV
jgi:hypothetical protein